MTEFKTGKFQSFRAVCKVHLGQIGRDLTEGAVVEFDGQTLKWGGEEHSIPSVAAAIRAGWLVDASRKNVAAYVPKPAGVKVHSAKTAGEGRGEEMAFEPAAEDEVVVGNLDGTNARRAKALSDSKGKGVTEAPPKDAGAKVTTKAAPRLPVDAPASAPAKKFPLQRDSEDDSIEVGKIGAAGNEGAKAVGKVRTPAVQKTTITDASAADRAIRTLDETPPPKVELRGKSAAVAEGEDIRKPQSGGATGDVAAARTGDDLSDLLPDAATSGAPKAGVSAAGGDAGLQWDKKDHWRKRIVKAVRMYADDQDAMKKILAVEAPNVVKGIKARLAAAKKK